MTTREERGAWVLAEYAGNYYPGAENTEDADGAYTVGADIIADIVHTLTDLGHPNPELVVDLAMSHYVEEQATPAWEGHRFQETDTGMPCEVCGHAYGVHSDR